MKRHVIIVNGAPRSGKDSTVEAMCRPLNEAGVHTEAFSSIDPVRAMLSGAGFELSRKTPADRALLATVGAAVELHSDWRSRWCVDMTTRFFERAGDGDAVMFLHIREPEIISRVRTNLLVMNRGSKVTLLLVRSPRAETTLSNDADRNVANIKYDVTVDNDGTLEDLARTSESVLFNLDLVGQLTLLA